MTFCVKNVDQKYFSVHRKSHSASPHRTASHHTGHRRKKIMTRIGLKKWNISNYRIFLTWCFGRLKGCWQCSGSALKTCSIKLIQAFSQDPSKWNRMKVERSWGRKLFSLGKKIFTIWFEYNRPGLYLWDYIIWEQGSQPCM